MSMDEVEQGANPLAMQEADVAVTVIDQLRKQWMGNEYDLVNRNCNHFTNELCLKLCDRKIPRYTTHSLGTRL